MSPSAISSLSELDLDRPPTRTPSRAMEVAGTSLAIWVLSYFLLDNTVFERISPAALAIENFANWPVWLLLTAICLICLCALIVLAALRRTDLEMSQVPIWLLVVILWMPIIAPCVHFPLNGSLKWLIDSSLVATSVGIIAGGVASRTGKARNVLATIGLIEAVYAIIYQRSHINLMLSGDVYRAGGTFNDPNALYTLMLVALPFSIMGVIRSSGNLSRIYFLVASSAEFAAMVLTFSRGGMLGVAMAIATLVFLESRSKKLTAMVIAGMLLLVMFVQCQRSSSFRDVKSVAGSNTSRLAIMGDGLKAFAAHPLIGIGAETFRQTKMTKTKHGDVYTVMDNPKNLFIYYLAERGVVGGVLFCLFAFTLYSLHRKALLDTTAISAAAAWIGLLVAGLVDTPFGPASRHVGNCCFGFLLAAAVGFPSTCRPSGIRSHGLGTNKNTPRSFTD